MCSIAGMVGRADPGVVERMIRLTAHRGPDGTGFFLHPQARPVVALGHGRLAIVDPQQGGQPLADEGGRTWIVTNGEIYNHRSLRRELARRGHRFSSHSDAEAALHLAEEAFDAAGTPASPTEELTGPWARALAARLATAFRRLFGMFAVAVWRSRPQGGGWLVLARDTVGIRPLYWGKSEAGVFFGSEIKAVRQAGSDYRAFPPGYVAVWSVAPGGEVAGPVMAPHTLLERLIGPVPVRRRPTGPVPGRLVGAVRGRPLGPVPGRKERAERLGEPGDAAPSPPDSEERAVEGLSRLMEDAVARRLMADVPVGVLLSGGVDSSLVAAMARRHYPGPLHSFAVGTHDSPDLPASRQAAEALGTVHHVRAFGRREAERVLPEVIYHLESFDAALVRSAVANYLVFQLASDYVKVALTGEGADELFAGYASLDGLRGAELDAELARLTRELHRTNLQRADRMSLAHGVEARVPFLDVRLIRWAFRLPAEFKRRPNGAGEEDKVVVRALGRRWLPASIAGRPKAKFSQGSGAAPILKALAEERIRDGEWARLASRYPDVPLASREQALYFRLFLDFFPEAAARLTVGATRSVVPGEVA